MAMFQNLGRSLRPHETLKILCQCGRRESWTYAEAMARLGPGAAPVDIRRRLTCSECGRKGRAEVSI